jgi:signal transduction histidine kinase
MRNNMLSKRLATYFDSALDLRLQAFNLLGLAGTAAGIIIAAVCVLQRARLFTVLFNLIPSAFAVILLRMVGKRLSLHFCCWVSAVFVFMIAFPIQFFATGGYRGGTPSFFIFAFIFTAILFERWERLAAIATEFVLYVGCCLTAYFWPDTVTYFDTEAAYVGDIITGIVVSGTLVILVILLYIRIYNNRQKQLEDANKRLSELDRMKTEFLQDMRHEMQNPLTTITRGIEFAENLMGRPDKADMARDALTLAQEESLRVGRMVESMINLSTMSGGADKREKVDFESLLVNCAETFRLQLDNRENSLHLEIDPGLPPVYGVADQLRQVLFNLFQNTAKHTRGGAVTLTASSDDTVITASVSDTGEGIPPEILTHVFERGFSGKQSSGYGLAICRTIVEAHGGTIWIDSEQGGGTAVTFTIPVYGGQSETREKSE